MISNGKPPFDPKAFLSKVNGGRPRILFSTFRAARSKRPSSPSRGRKPWSHFSEQTISLAKGVWPDSHCVCQLSPQ